MSTLAIALNEQKVAPVVLPEKNETAQKIPGQLVKGIRAKIIFYTISIRLLFHAIKKYRSIKSLGIVVNRLAMIRKIQQDGKSASRYIKASGKFYTTMYAPGYPSNPLTKMYDFEMERIKATTDNKVPYLRFVFLAITSKCPLKCEHCFESENLNKKELLTYEDLRNTIIGLKEAGIVQVFLSGGEPMLRVKDMLKLAIEFHNELELWILTSGFNATYENLTQLKQAGITGLFVSLDHYDKTLHNVFRGSKDAYGDAVAAIKNARSLDMPVAMSICVTRSLANEKDLMAYATLAKELDASFIQLLEPKSVGNFSGKDILLNEEEKKVIEQFSRRLNNDKKYENFPITLYHGYHQRQVGCFAAGNRSLYIDSKGDILSCPFCHHKSGNVLTDNLTDAILSVRSKGCTDYRVADF